MRPLCIFVVFAAALPAFYPAAGQEARYFRVANEIFQEGQKAPIRRSLTLFKEELVYDFAFDGADGETIAQATLYDFTRNRFLIVDYRENLKIEVSQQLLLRLMSELATKLENKDPLLKEAASPEFKVTREENLFKFTGTRIKYEVKGFESILKNAVTDYQRFADWSARLTTLQGGQPPMARIAVNKELAAAGLMPKEVVLLRTPSPVWETVNKLSSKHIVDWQLTKTDGKRIEALDAKMAEMETTNWTEYLEKVAEKSGASKKR